MIKFYAENYLNRNNKRYSIPFVSPSKLSLAIILGFAKSTKIESSELLGKIRLFLN